MQTPSGTPPQRERITKVAEFRHFAQTLNRDRPLTIPAEFRVRESDIIIATYPKCGTTWTQQIVHGLRTRGSMDFAEISLVVPWLALSPLLGIDPNAEQVANPRAFKSHMPWYLLPKGGRYIFVTRDPGDTLVSFFHFLRGLIFEGDEIDLEVFAEDMFFAEAVNGHYWDHLRSWWEVRERDDVLFLCFEDMKTDLRAHVARIAQFCRIEADAELIDIATRQAEYSFMRAHEPQFNDEPTARVFTGLAGVAPAVSTKVRTGRVGDGQRELPAAVVDRLDETWRRQIAEPLGFGSYEALRAALGPLSSR